MVRLDIKSINTVSQLLTNKGAVGVLKAIKDGAGDGGWTSEKDLGNTGHITSLIETGAIQRGSHTPLIEKDGEKIHGEPENKYKCTSEGAQLLALLESIQGSGSSGSGGGSSRVSREDTE